MENQREAAYQYAVGVELQADAYIMVLAVHLRSLSSVSGSILWQGDTIRAIL